MSHELKLAQPIPRRKIKGVTHALGSVSTPRCSNDLRRRAACYAGSSHPIVHDASLGASDAVLRPRLLGGRFTPAITEGVRDG